MAKERKNANKTKLSLFFFVLAKSLIKSAPKPVTVTFSGAERLLQSDKVLTPLHTLRDEFIHKEEAHLALVGGADLAPQKAN